MTPGRTGQETGDEAALAAQERADADCQAILRRHRDLLNLSVVLARPVAAAPPATGHSWWQDLDSQWSFLSDGLAPSLIGQARIYLARSADPPGPHVDDLLPSAGRISNWQAGGAAVSDGLTIWEAPPWPDDRALRRFVLAFNDDDEADRRASTWAWSRGDTAIPPFARYLVHAAKLRFLYRIWSRQSKAHEFAAEIRAKAEEVRQLTSGADEGTLAGQLHRSAGEARLMSADLRELRRAAEIATDNMGLVVNSDGLLAAGGPFADDRDLARSFLARVDDELFYLDIATDRVTRSAGKRWSRLPGVPLPTCETSSCKAWPWRRRQWS